MAEFTLNPERFDPHKNFEFRVKWDGRYVADVSKVSALAGRLRSSLRAVVTTPRRAIDSRNDLTHRRRESNRCIAP